MNKNLVIIIFCFASCYSVKINDGTNGGVCTEDRAIEIAENFMNDHYSNGDFHDIYYRSIIITDSLFSIQYLNKDTLRRGDGGRINISKENCKVVKIELYQ